MKITAVEVHRVLVHAPDPPFVWRRGLPGSPAEGYGAVLQIRPTRAATVWPFSAEARLERGAPRHR